MKNSERDIPLEGELNPNHPMTRFARDQWHKICAVLMQKMEASHKIPGLPDYEVEITVAEIHRLSERDMAVVMHERDGRLFIRFMPREMGEKLAKQEGGFPA